MKTPENASKLALNLIALRKSMGLTQAQVASAIGTKRSTYAYYERDTMPSIEIIEKLAKIYRITPSRVMFSDEAPKEDGSLVLHDGGGIAPPKIEFATLTEEEQNLLVKARLLSEQEKQELLEKIDELLSRAE